MQAILRLLALTAVLGLPWPAAAQSPPYFPQTLPPNTVVGRIGGGQAGPAEAIPFSSLPSLVFASGNTPTIIGGSTSSSTLTLESTSGAGTTDYIAFLTGSQVEAARFTTTGNLWINATVDHAPGGGSPPSRVLIANDSINRYQLQLYGYGNNAQGPEVIFAKNRGATEAASQVANQAGDLIATFWFAVTDGSNYNLASSIVATVDGAVSAGVAPTRLDFFTGTSNFGNDNYRITSGNAHWFNLQGITTDPGVGGTSARMVIINDSIHSFQVAYLGYLNDNTGPQLVFGKTRNANPAVLTANQSADLIGGMWFTPNDGSNYLLTSFIGAYVDGAVSAAVGPMRLSFQTGATNSAVEALRIDSNQSVILFQRVAVASLPSCGAGQEGALRAVNNANATTFNSIVAGGGANHVLVYCNGTNWVIGG